MELNKPSMKYLRKINENGDYSILKRYLGEIKDIYFDLEDEFGLDVIIMFYEFAGYKKEAPHNGPPSFVYNEFDEEGNKLGQISNYHYHENGYFFIYHYIINNDVINNPEYKRIKLSCENRMESILDCYKKESHNTIRAYSTFYLKSPLY